MTKHPLLAMVAAGLMWSAAAAAEPIVDLPFGAPVDVTDPTPRTVLWQFESTPCNGSDRYGPDGRVGTDDDFGLPGNPTLAASQFLLDPGCAVRASDPGAEFKMNLALNDLPGMPPGTDLSLGFVADFTSDGSTATVAIPGAVWGPVLKSRVDRPGLVTIDAASVSDYVFQIDVASGEVTDFSWTANADTVLGPGTLNGALLPGTTANWYSAEATNNPGASGAFAWACGTGGFLAQPNNDPNADPGSLGTCPPNNVNLSPATENAVYDPVTGTLYANASSIVLPVAPRAWGPLDGRLVDGWPQTIPQQTCINGINANALGVLKARNKNSSTCLKNVAAGKLTVDQCLGIDVGGKIAKAEAKTSTTELKKCQAPKTPGFAYTSASTANAGANDGALAAVKAVFGDAPAIADKKTDKAGAACQAEVAKRQFKLQDTWLAEANKAKKAALKGEGTNPPPVSDPTELATAINAAVEGAGNKKITDAENAVNSGLDKKCGGVTNLADLFECEGLAATTDQLAACVIVAAEGEACRALEQADELSLPCRGEIEWVFVGDPGNAADTATNCLNNAPGCGSVPYAYRISKYEVTNAQYAEFLNAKAASDPLALYNPSMGSDAIFGGITRSGADGGYTYTVTAGFEDKPVVLVSFYDALRFTNWLNNGQGSGDTETGAYTITVDGITNNTIMRNPGATTFLPSENEWYKAAYYDPALPGYYENPAGTNTPTTCAMPGDAPNTANCDAAVGGLTDVGSYSGSASPYGTFDQGGNVWEWTEQITGYVIFSRVAARGLYDAARLSKGGSANATNTYGTTPGVGVFPEGGSREGGFRVAAVVPVPEPAHALLVLTGGLVLAAARRQRRA